MFGNCFRQFTLYQPPRPVRRPGRRGRRPLRRPGSRRGKIHILNSLFTSTGNSYCSNAGQDAQLLVEGTVYNGVKAPFQVTQNGTLRAPAGSNVFTATSGTTTGTGNGFSPTYPYTVEPASGIQAAVQAGAGPH